MSDPLAGRRVALGVSGSIAAYKAATLASRLVQAGAAVDVLMTRGARKLVRPLTFQAITHRRVVTDLWAPVGEMAIDHVSIARAIDLLVIAPATADVLARLALGRADDALTTTALATRAPILVAPAMEPQMWSHAATQGHVSTLIARGVAIVGPEEGRMASGELGVGRMTEPEVLVEHARVAAARLGPGPLSGRRVVVTAGPTREPIDPVRYLSNHSSGTMGHAIARAARDRGADVVLVSGPTCLDAPVGTTLVPVETAADMCREVLARAPEADLLVMTAAVADYRPATFSDRKIKKSKDALTLTLAPNPDILMELDRRIAGATRRPLRVGFAAETEDLVANADAKRRAKGLDLIVANPVPASFGESRVAAVLLDDGGATSLELTDKSALAEAILDRASRLLDVLARGEGPHR